MRHAHFPSLLFRLVRILVLLGILAATGTGLTPALASQTNQTAPAAPSFEGPIIGTPAYPAVFTGDVRNLPQVKGNLPLREIPNPQEPASTLTSAPARSLPNLQDWMGSEAPMPSPSTTFNGLDLNNWGAGWPPDTNGDVGPKHYIQTVNTSIGIYDKAGGNRLAAFTYDDFFDGTGTLCDANNYGDPVVLYDGMADRWIITDFAFTVTGSGNPQPPFYECIAVSRTSDPVSGGWYQYGFLADSSYMNDYPKLSVWPDAYYMTASMFLNGAIFAGVRVWALDRASMLSGGPLNNVYFNAPLNFPNPNTTYRSLLPSNLRGAQPPAGSPNYVVAMDASASVLNFWRFHVDWTTPGYSTLTGPTTIAVTGANVICSGNRNCVPQPGTTQTVDALSNRLLMQLQYRNINGTESLWANQTVDPGTGVAGIHWYEIRNLQTTPTIYQDGIYAPNDGTYRWMGSVAADRLGNMALGYSASSGSVYPSIRYAGRLVGDTLGTLPQSEVTMFTGTGSQTSYNRWGDYSAMTVDPEDDCTFWYTQEYYTTISTDWQTGIGAFKYGTCSSTKNWVGGTSSAWNDASNWSPASIPTRYDDVNIDPAYKTNNWPTLDADAEAHSVTITDGATLNAAANFTLTVYGNWSQNGSGAFNATAGAVNLAGTVPTVNLSTPGSGNQFFNLQIGDGTRTPNLTLNSDLQVAGSLSIGSGSIVNAGSYSIQVGGDFNSQGTFNAGTGTVQFNGGSSHTLTTASALYNVQASGTGMVTLGSNLGANDLTVDSGAVFDLSTFTITVEGTLTNNGTLRQTQNVSSGTATNFLLIKDIAGTTTKYYGVDITPNTTGMGATTVVIRGNQTACNQGDQLIHRCFDITPTSAQSSTVRFWYLNSEAGSENVSNMQAYHWNNPGWTALTLAGTPRGSVGNYNWVEAVNVSSYSPFGLSDGNPSAPTALTLSDFTTRATENQLPIAFLVLGLILVAAILFAKRTLWVRK